MISVIIPVYNAEPFVAEAVESALQQPEVDEILLIEDGSLDRSLEICRELDKKYEKVLLLQHLDGGNHGPSASRNLGIRNAKCEIIAFLDADDIYLPNRFKYAVSILIENPKIDGVYEATGTFFENQNSMQLFKKTPQEELLSINDKIDPNRLFEAMMLGKAGTGFSFNGFTGRTNTFRNNDILFDEELNMHEDTLLAFQLSAVVNLVGGEIIHPVSLRRIHSNNRITNHQLNQRRTFFSRTILYKKLLLWARGNLGFENISLVLIGYVKHLKSINNLDDYSFRDFLYSVIRIAILFASHPRIFFTRKFWIWLRSTKTFKIFMSQPLDY